jgi:hypothetical protein
VKLVITRSQSKGLTGSVSFEIRGQVRLTPEEQKLVDYYKMHNDVLCQKKMVSIWGAPTDVMIDIRVKKLLSGEGTKCKDLGEVIAYGESLKSACASLKSYLEAAASFGGEEVHEF